MHRCISALVLVLLLLPASLLPQGTRLLRYPAASGQSVAFVYANDLWIVGREGGEARRLTSSPGTETQPVFSPDGKTIAFTANYAGNFEVYRMDASGGEPQRLTWHPGFDRALGWTPDGTRIIFASDRTSAPSRAPQLWSMPAEGGVPERMPLRSVVRAAYSASGSLLAYEDARWQAEWKWYRGGQAMPVRIVSLPSLAMRTVPGPVSVNSFPVFLGEQLYFLSDRAGAFNIFSFDPATSAVKQITRHESADVKSLAAGGGMLVYELGGEIHTLDPASGNDRTLVISVHGDFPQAMPQWRDVRKNIASATLSPNGARALFEARGEIFTVPAEKGDARNLTNSPGAADRQPAWSPDGQRIAWFSDQGGEYALMIADQTGLVPPEAIPIEHPDFFYATVWSPNSKYIACTTAGRNLLVIDVEKKSVKRIDTDRSAHPDRSMVPAWSPDSRWIAYAKQLPNKYRAIMIHSLKEGRSWQITDGLSDVITPVWDLNGKYLYFLASTDVALNTGWLDLSSEERPQRRGVYFAVLAKDTPSPLLPESDDEKAAPADKDKKKSADDAKKKGADSADVKIDFEGIAHRILALPLAQKNYGGLDHGAAGILFTFEFTSPILTGNAWEVNAVRRWDMSKRKDAPFLSNVKSFGVSQNGAKVLYQSGDDWFIAGSEAEPKAGDGRLNLELKMKLDPVAEWKQIYHEAWRLHRDYFYVPNLHGVDWNAVHDKYAVLLPYVRHRADLNYLIDMMGGELGVGHHFTGGGDAGEQPNIPMGLLGADVTVDNGRFTFTRILTGENWNPDLRAPLAAPGIDVHEGDYLIAINGKPVVPPIPPESALEGLAGKQVTLTVNSRPSADGARSFTVVPVASESALRSRAWVEDNRRMVDKLSNGALAYVWLPNTASEGYTYFNRYYFGQQDRQGAILDERFNGGGQIADYIIDIVARRLRGYFNNPVGDREPWTEPLSGIWGPKVMLINEFAGSGGDMMPFMFRQQQLGPLVGTRTWGGLVGIWDYPDLIDGGSVTVPRGGFFNLNGEWDVENKGVAPDIEVDILPADVAAGRDPQIERGVEEALRLLQANPVRLLKEPAPPVQAKPKGE